MWATILSALTFGATRMQYLYNNEPVVSKVEVDCGVSHVDVGAQTI